MWRVAPSPSDSTPGHEAWCRLCHGGPEDRRLLGVISISENIQLGDLVRGKNPLHIVSKSQARVLSKHWGGKLAIKSISGDASVIELSGGNQQKVVIAKSLVQEPKLVIFDEPTRGVDVGAIAEIHQLIGELADAAVAVVVISSYIPEVLAVSDRILVAPAERSWKRSTPPPPTSRRSCTPPRTSEPPESGFTFPRDTSVLVHARALALQIAKMPVLL